jgi:hypothetical protein
MSMGVNARARALARRGQPDIIQFRLLYVICFSLFLIAGVLHRLLPWTWFAERAKDKRLSLLEQASNAAGICASYAFMA